MAGAPWQFVAVAQGTNASNASVATAKITKTGGVASTWDSGAASVQSIAADGFVEFVVNATGTYRSIGLSALSGSPSTIDNTIDWSINLRGGGTPTALLVTENGNLVFTGTYAVGDTFRVGRVGTQIRYYKNGELIWTSAVAANGSLMVDTAFFDSASIIDAIRLYDGASKTWRALAFVTTNTTVTAGTSFTTRRLTFTAPTTIREGDHAIAVIGSQGPEFVSATSVAWDLLATYYSATNNRAVSVYRRIATDGEPIAYTFDLAVTQDTIGGLLVYRNLDPALVIRAGGLTDFSSNTIASPPAVAQLRASDLLLSGVLLVGATPTIAPTLDAVERLDFTQALVIPAAGITLKLEANEAKVSALSTVRRSALLSVAGSGAAFSFGLAGMPLPVHDSTFAPVVPGAIGLPVEGI